MKVISILQPWASLIVHGHKKIETRSWNTKYRGEILIHASMGEQFRKIHHNDPFYRFYHPLFASSAMEPIEKLPFGAIIGKVNLIEVQPIDFFIQCSKSIPLKKDGEYSELEWQQELAFGDYSPNRYGWLLSDPVAFAEPIPAKGKLGLWEYDLPENLVT